MLTHQIRKQPLLRGRTNIHTQITYWNNNRCALFLSAHSLYHIPQNVFTHSKHNEARRVKSNTKIQVVHMKYSIQNDADIMLLISQHFNIVSVTESDTVFRVTSKERELHKPRLWANMDAVKVQTGTFDIYMYIYITQKYTWHWVWNSLSLVFPSLNFGKGCQSFHDVACFIIIPLPFYLFIFFK